MGNVIFEPKMKPHFLTMLLVTLFMVESAHSADPVKKLASIRDFAFGGIGAAGIISEGEVAFRGVLARPTAETDFTALLDSGNAQARCYSLVGLHVISPKAFAVQVKRFERDKTTVSTISGCMVMALPMSSVVTNISAGRYDSHVKK